MAEPGHEPVRHAPRLFDDGQPGDAQGHGCAQLAGRDVADVAFEKKTSGLRGETAGASGGEPGWCVALPTGP